MDNMDNEHRKNVDVWTNQTAKMPIIQNGYKFKNKHRMVSMLQWLEM